MKKIWIIPPVPKENKNWRYVGVFYDVESGLRRKGRTELDKMFKKAEKGRYMDDWKVWGKFYSN